jgi:hypothetical protein
MNERQAVILDYAGYSEYCKQSKDKRAANWFIEGDKLTTNRAVRDGCIEVSNSWLSTFVPRRFVHVVEIAKP